MEKEEFLKIINSPEIKDLLRLEFIKQFYLGSIRGINDTKSIIDEFIEMKQDYIKCSNLIIILDDYKKMIEDQMREL